MHTFIFNINWIWNKNGDTYVDLFGLFHWRNNISVNQNEERAGKSTNFDQSFIDMLIRIYRGIYCGTCIKGNVRAGKSTNFDQSFIDMLIRIYRGIYCGTCIKGNVPQIVGLTLTWKVVLSWLMTVHRLKKLLQVVCHRRLS